MWGRGEINCPLIHGLGPALPLFSLSIADADTGSILGGSDEFDAGCLESALDVPEGCNAA